RVRDGRLTNWTTGWLTHPRRTHESLPERLAVASPERTDADPLVGPGQYEATREDLKKQITNAAIAFRGYDITNLGRSHELLEHPVYAPIVRGVLDRASVLCSEVLHQEVDLAERVLAREASLLTTFVEDTATIVAMEVAQIELLKTVFEVPVQEAQLTF